MTFRYSTLTLTVFVAFISSPVQAQDVKLSPPSYEEALAWTEEGVELLQPGYSERSGLWRGTGWWNNANVLTALIRFAKWTDQKEKYLPILENTLVQAQRRNKNFLNEFYDDEGWWALAWVDAYELTNDKKYLDQAETIFLDMTTGWSELYGGGMHWKKDDRYKNSITNNLFTLLSLRLHRHLPETRVEGESYLQWGLKNWKWYEQSGMINRDTSMIEDGLRRNDGRPNRNQHWTYNQGVAIAVLVELAQLKEETKGELQDSLSEDHLALAMNIADATISRLSRNGILRERNEPNCGADGEQFKGIFMRHLYTLYEATKQEKYRDFIVTNAVSIRDNRQEGSGAFGVTWNENDKRITTATHSSALEALIAMIGVLR